MKLIKLAKKENLLNDISEMLKKVKEDLENEGVSSSINSIRLDFNQLIEDLEG